MSVQINTVVRIDPNLVDQAGLVVSQDNSCRFSFVVQHAFLRVLGMSEKRITQLEQALLTNDFTPPERAALDFARRLSKSKPLATQSDLVPLKEKGFDNIRGGSTCFGVVEIRSRGEPIGALPGF